MRKLTGQESEPKCDELFANNRSLVTSKMLIKTLFPYYKTVCISEHKHHKLYNE